MNGKERSTAIGIDEFLYKDGIVILQKYSQMFKYGPLPMKVYLKFVAKEVLINSEIKDDSFTLD